MSNYVFDTDEEGVALTEKQWEEVSDVLSEYNQRLPSQNVFLCEEWELRDLISDVLIALQLAPAR